MKKNWITGKIRLFLAIPAVLIVAALVLSIFGIGMDMGIDFTGGSLLTYSVGENFDTADVETVLQSAGYPDALVTKTDPSQASIDLQAELAAEAAEPAEEAVEEAAEETEEAAEETEEAAEETVEETVEETFVPMLNMDKSGIADDGMTDLEIRLTLVDETEGMEEAVNGAVLAANADAKVTLYRAMTGTYANQNNLDAAYANGYVFEYEMGTEDFDAEAITDAVAEALTAAEIDVESVCATAFAPVAETEEIAEEAAEETEATEEETVEEAVEEAAPATSLRVLVNINDQTSHVREILEREMSAKYENFSFLSIDHVSATAGRSLVSNALKALLIAFACMLIYIAIRFDALSGLAALLALVHDVLIMCAFMVFFRAFFQVNSSFIAAVLTIVGYSINNTIIIFDRIRENAKKPGMTQKPKMEIVDSSVRSTLSRTINTTVTTLITLVLLYAFGIETIREFAFPLIVGMLAGVYSSVMVSGQIWALMSQKRADRKAANN